MFEKKRKQKYVVPPIYIIASTLKVLLVCAELVGTRSALITKGSRILL